MAILQRIEDMNLANKGGPTKQLKYILDFYKTDVAEFEAHINYLREELDVCQAQKDVVQRENDWYRQKYGPPVLKTYSKKTKY